MTHLNPTQIAPRTSPLQVKFVITSLPVGGAETLLLNLVKRMDRAAFSPEVVCLKEAGELGEAISSEVPVHTNLLSSKWDVRVLGRLKRLFQQSRTDAVITVGAGDKMFWGRLAAWRASVPVVCSALHSTGWPDGVGRLNRKLTPITDGFIACARNHAEHLISFEQFPKAKVFTVPNGVDTDRFRPNHTCRNWLRSELLLDADVSLVGIIAALREEKNHIQLVRAAREVLRGQPNTHFVVVGDGPERGRIEEEVRVNGLAEHFHLLGNRSDTERVLAGLDVFCLTSKNEANPVSILEALSCGIPVVAPDVGSICETVLPGKTGLLTSPLSFESTADCLKRFLGNPVYARQTGMMGRQLVRGSWSLDAMVGGYETLISDLFNLKAARFGLASWERPQPVSPVANAVDKDAVFGVPGMAVAEQDSMLLHAVSPLVMPGASPINSLPTSATTTSR